MATTTTIPTVKQRLVVVGAAAFDDAGYLGGDVPVTYTWPGPDTQEECAFLGPHPDTADIRLDGTSQIPTIKAGRKQRQEEYTVRFTIWEFRPDLTVVAAATCEAQAFALLGLLEDELANDVRIGLPATTVQDIQIDAVASTLFPFNAGWACEIAVDLAVRARLT